MVHGTRGELHQHWLLLSLPSLSPTTPPSSTSLINLVSQHFGTTCSSLSKCAVTFVPWPSVCLPGRLSYSLFPSKHLPKPLRLGEVPCSKKPRAPPATYFLPLSIQMVGVSFSDKCSLLGEISPDILGSSFPWDFLEPQALMYHYAVMVSHYHWERSLSYSSLWLQAQAQCPEQSGCPTDDLLNKWISI